MATAKLTPAKLNKIDWTQSNSAIAAKLHVSKQTIDYHRRVRGKASGPQGAPRIAPSKKRSWIISSIDARRIQEEFTLADLAAAAKLKPQTVSDILAGRRVPSLFTADKLIHALGGKPFHPRLFSNTDGWTQAQLAAKLNISQPHLSNLLTGHKSPKLPLAEKLLKALDIREIKW